MFQFNCQAANYSVQCFANEKKALKPMVRRALKACAGTEGRAFAMREFPSDYDTREAQEMPWIEGRDFIILDEMEVLWVKGLTYDIKKGEWL